jgi:hypothetical protein
VPAAGPPAGRGGGVPTTQESVGGVLAARGVRAECPARGECRVAPPERLGAGVLAPAGGVPGAGRVPQSAGRAPGEA